MICSASRASTGRISSVPVPSPTRVLAESAYSRRASRIWAHSHCLVWNRGSSPTWRIQSITRGSKKSRASQSLATEYWYSSQR